MKMTGQIPGSRMGLKQYVYRVARQRPFNPRELWAPDMPLPIDEWADFELVSDGGQYTVTLLPNQYTLATEPRVLSRGCHTVPLTRRECNWIVADAIRCL